MSQAGETTGQIYDWNRAGPRVPLVRPGVTFLDETLRDGIQSSSVVDPPTHVKIELIHRMDGLGIHVVNVGLPASSKRNYDDVLACARAIVDGKLAIKPAAAGRTVVSDLVPIVEASQAIGAPIEVYTFIGSSPIRQLTETWDVARLERMSAEAISFAAKAGLPVAYVTEDTTRSRPEVLATLFKSAIDHGARRICLADTVGHATPDGVRNIVQFTRAIIAETGVPGVEIDWHGHNDRGLALEDALWALESGADRVHGCALGIGERVGNAPMELLLLNLKLLGEIDHADMDKLTAYCKAVAEAVHWEVHPHYPLIGRYAHAPVHGLAVG